MAERLIDLHRLGRGPARDLLALSFSATDCVGHRFGTGGAEMCTQLHALDGVLGALLSKLDATGAPYLVVLTADHGSLDAAERRGPPAVRVDTAGVVAGLATHLKSAFGLTYDPIVSDDARQLVIALAPVDDRRRVGIVADAVRWLKARPEVAGAYTADEIAAAAPPAGKPAPALTIPERFAESFDRERSGDIAVNYAQFASLGVPQGPGAVIAGHGSPWDYDRRVPILFWWPGVRPAQPADPIETVDIAPTLAASIGLATPPVDGRPVALDR